MKRFLSVIGGLALLVVLGIGGFAVYVMHQGQRLDASSKAYVEANVPAIVSTWSRQALLERASPQLLREIQKHPGQLGRMFRRLSSLGAMQSFGGVKGESNVSYTTQNGKATTAAYVARAVFANGAVRIKLRLILQAGKWRFLNFYVTAPSSLQPQSPAQSV